MAEVWVRPRKETNGDGSSYENALNTFVGHTYSANIYRVAGGILRETITSGSNDAVFEALDFKDPPIIDCEVTRASGINLNLKLRNQVTGFKIINQKADAPNAAIRVTGSNHSIKYCDVSSNRHGIHINNGSNNTISRNKVDVGRFDDLDKGWGVRINGNTSLNNIVEENYFISSRITSDMFINGVAFGVAIESNGSGSTILRRNRLHANMCDQVILRGTTSNTLVESNYCYALGMLDGIDMLDSNNCTMRLNTIIHPGLVSGHAGPCSAIGDDYGLGVASTNIIVKENIIWATNRLCMSIRPLGAGFQSIRNKFLVSKGNGNAIINLRKTGDFVATSYEAWMTESFVDNDSLGIMNISDLGFPLLTSNLINTRNDSLFYRDINNIMNTKNIGALAPALFRS